MMTPSLRTFFPSIASGMLLGASFPGWYLFPLAWMALVPLLRDVAERKPRQAAARFFVSGMVFHLFLLQWLMANVYWAGGWAFAGYVALCVYLAGYWAALGGIWAWLGRHLSPTLHILSLGVLWAAMEVSQARLFTGFGWSALAYSQGANLPAAQWAAIGGYALISLWVVWANGFLAAGWVNRGKRLHAWGTALILVAATHGLGWGLIDSPEYGKSTYHAGLVQADFPLEMKWDWEYDVEMVRNAATKSRLLAENRPVDLFVWPESLVVDELSTPAIYRHVEELTQNTGAFLFTGTTRRDFGTGSVFNSSALVSPDGEITEQYDKVHLAPFGEYFPFGEYLPFVAAVVPIIGDLKAGTKLEVIEAGTRDFGPLICFEVLFSPMALELREKGADFLTVITNLGWFGASSAIPQELEIARIRAIETRLPVVHCANTGISGVFDPWGRFEGVQGRMSWQGRYVEDDVQPRATIMQRRMGSLPVPLAADPLVPNGPRAFPWLALALSACLIGAGAVQAYRGSDSK